MEKRTMKTAKKKGSPTSAGSFERSEDIAEIMGVAEMISNHIQHMESKMIERTERLETHVQRLEQEIGELLKHSEESRPKFRM